MVTTTNIRTGADRGETSILKSMSDTKAKLLLVDDKPENLDALELMLGIEGRFEFTKVTSGQAALDALEIECDYAALLLDVAMPGMDGYELASRIKEDPRVEGIPIVFISGQPDSTLTRGYEVGAVDYVLRPFNPDILRSKLNVMAELWENKQKLVELARLQSESKLAEEQERSERRYQRLAEAIPQMVWTADPQGRLQYLNRRWREYTGDDAENVLAGWAEFVHAMDLTRAMEAQKRGSKEAYEVEMRIRRYDGQYRWHLARILPMYDESNELTGWVGTMTDINDRKRFEEQLLSQFNVANVLNQHESLSEASGELLDAMASAMRWDIALLWEREGDTLYNVAIRHSDPLKPEVLATLTSPLPVDGSVLGSVFLAGKPWTTEDLSVARFQPLIEEGVADFRSWAAFAIVLGDESLAVVEFLSHEENLADKPLLRLMGSLGQQIGQFVERQEVALALRSSEELKGSILASTLDAIVTVDQDGIITEWNNAAEGLFMYTREEAVGHEMSTLIIPSEHRMQNRDATVGRRGPLGVIGERLSLPAMRKDSSTFSAEIVVTQANLPGKTLFNSFIRDVTEQEKARALVEEAESRYRALVEGLPLATYVMNVQDAITYCSPQITPMLGWDPDQVVAEDGFWWDHLHPVDRDRIPKAWEEWRGMDCPDKFTAEYQLARADGSYMWGADVAVPVRGGDGNILFLQGCILDITERKELEIERSQLYEREYEARYQAEYSANSFSLLAHTGEVLSGPLDYERSLHSISELLAPDFADFCAIDLLKEKGAIGHMALCLNAGPAHHLLKPDRPGDPLALGGAAEVIRSGKTKFLPSISDAEVAALRAQNPALDAELEESKIHSLIIVPLMSQEKAIGAITLAMTSLSCRDFADSDLELFDEIARRVSLAMENARLYAARNEVASILESSLIPPSLPRVPGTDVFARYHPAAGNRIGGDFYDLFPLPDGTWLAAIGDVVGKGAEAAALTGLVRHTLRAIAMHENDLELILSSLNEAIIHGATEGQFCTILCAKLKPGNCCLEITLANAGHPEPYLINNEIRKIDCRGVPLGMWPVANVGITKLTLTCGDKLLFFTDGVPEARHEGQFFGTEGLTAFLADHHDAPGGVLAASLEARVVEFQPNGASDDIAILVIEALDANERSAYSSRAAIAPGEGPRIDLRLECNARSVSVARHALDELEGQIDSDCLATAQLLISEIVSNAVKYSLCDEDSYIGFTAELRPGALRVTVSDQGLGFAIEFGPADVDDETGRGLFLVETLADSWGVKHGDRTEVWFELVLAAS